VFTAVIGNAVASTCGASRQCQEERNAIMRYVVLWALGVPITGLIVLHLLGLI
jgi:hypothetical protein